ncbi:unnamed protein product [Peronospora belbahrii]|uniref:PDZ domain-containing protein n=1 Tax=Peronospora belbahrii TaxID=622444 RepID=A0AAU9L875_9STRA|nr:unnamed protein product [Peronospora belbahrii]
MRSSTSEQSLSQKPSMVSSTMNHVDSSAISLQLKDLLTQLHQLSVDIRVSNTSSSSLTYSVKDTGARIKGFSSRSDVLGVELLVVGDVLKDINDVSVISTSFASITRFLKHSKAICKLYFRSVSNASTTSKCSMGSNPAVREQDNAIYLKVSKMLETTLKKVSAVEETVRLSSTMSLYT